MPDREERQKIEETIQKLEAAKASSALDTIVADASIAALKDKLAAFASLEGDGAIAQGENAKAAGQDAVLVGRDVSGNLTKGDGNIVNSTVIVAGDGARIVIGDNQPVEMKASLRKTALGRYLEHIIAHNRYLQLQGIRSGGKLVNIELEQIYITLRTTQQRTIQAEEEWLKHEAEFAPGEMHKRAGMERLGTETVNVKVEQALAAHRHIVVLGDPGSGKTTLLRYLALLYGRDLAQGQEIVREKLKLNESGHLPVLLPLRQMGQYLKAHHEKPDGTDGCALLLDFLHKSLERDKIGLPADFFDEYLEEGRATVLLDGMDEVADPDLRARVARLVEAFTLAYPKCRFVVTSRIVGYSGPARLGGDYVTTTVRDFTLEDVRQFLTHWHRLVAIGQMGAGQDAETSAASQTSQLLSAIEANERVRELAINPLMLTVIALVHRDRVKLPDRRAELYAEAVDVLLGKWDEARGVGEISILDDRPFDAGDRRLLLQSIALTMHEREKKELEAAELRGLLMQAFRGMTPDESAARRAVDRFLTVVEERTGLLAARGEGVYAFSHLTFQEYLAALAVAARDDYVEFILVHSGEAWWKEVILLVAGFLSSQSKERTSKLIRAIVDNKKEPVPYHNLVLASECIRDVGNNRMDGDLQSKIQSQLRTELETPVPSGWLGAIQIRLKRGLSPEQIREQRIAAASALAKIGGQQFWTMPYGEPEWITIPAGEFWMGGEGPYYGKPVHKLSLPEYQIARVPVTNAQYAIFVKAASYQAPSGWEEGRPPKGKESHPVVNVSWFDAMAYCAWLGKVTGKNISLPSEAEWEKAARGPSTGSGSQRAYPWGDPFDSSKCNSSELGLDGTTPVGIFLEGASPYGLLDMSGNVWEWTRSFGYDVSKYPYNPADGREDISRKDVSRGLRGGSFLYVAVGVRCAYRDRSYPDLRGDHYGFRVVVCSPFFSH